MKIKSLLTIVILIWAVSANAQMKVTNNGNVGIGLSQPQAKLDLYGGRVSFNYNRYGYHNAGLSFAFWNDDPRIYSYSSNKVVFYNNESWSHCDIEVRTCYQTIPKKYWEESKGSITGALDKIKLLTGVTYQSEDGISRNNKNRRRAGFIAEEIEQVIPEVVLANDSNKVKGISYSGIIPYIVEAMKEQQKEIEQLKFEINSLKDNKGNKKSGSLSGNNNQSGLTQDNPILYQNMPNPFIQETKINYYLPDDTQKASLLIFNMQGTEIKNIIINQFESNSVSIKGSELKAGMYFYTLTANGKEIDTKKMILTKN